MLNLFPKGLCHFHSYSLKVFCLLVLLLTLVIILTNKTNKTCDFTEAGGRVLAL